MLRPTGVLVANVADGPPLTYSRRLLAAVRSVLPQAVLRADPAVLKGRRFGNIVLAAARSELPTAAITRAAAAAMFPQRVMSGADIVAFSGGAKPLTDSAAQRSPEPPEQTWRVGG